MRKFGSLKLTLGLLAILIDRIVGKAGKMTVHPTRSEIIVATSSWHLASANIARGLRALNIPAEEVLEDTPRFEKLGFVHPGTAHLAATLRRLPVAELRGLAKSEGTLRHDLEPLDAATAAVLRDDAEALRGVLQRSPFEAGDLTAILCCAAASGAREATRACLEVLRSRSNEPQDFRQSIDRQDGQPIVAGGEPLNNAPLHYATLSGDLAVCDMLLSYGADPNVLNPVQTPPVYDAARAGNFALMKRLHEAGAHLHLRNAYGDTLVHRLAEYAEEATTGYLAIYDYLQTNRQQIESAFGEDFSVFLNQPNKMGITALDMVTVRGQSSLAQKMRADGAQHSAIWSRLPLEKRTYHSFKHTDEWNQIQDEWARSRTGLEAA